MKNYVKPGHRLTFTAPSGGVVGGQGYLIGATFGVAVASMAEGKPFELQVDGVFELSKTAAQAQAEGVLLYWDNTNKLITTVASGNTKIGVVAKAALAADATGLVRLNGAF